MIGTLLEVDGRTVYRLAGRELFVPDDLAREERFMRSAGPQGTSEKDGGGRRLRANGESDSVEKVAPINFETGLRS
jgi:hypothetical protein